MSERLLVLNFFFIFILFKDACYGGEAVSCSDTFGTLGIDFLVFRMPLVKI
tara:strand:+ start:1044 stop:1196 length:153 start_codon:yes stop_codon:yes gene_type:complete